MSAHILWVLMVGTICTSVTCDEAFVTFNDKTSDEKCSLPDNLDLTITVDIHVYNVTLTASTGGPDNIPVYVVSQDETGSYLYHRLNSLNTQTRQYQNVTLLAAMTVRCYRHINSNRLEVSGSFITPSGDHVRLEKDSRHRRWAKTVDGRDVYRLVKEVLRERNRTNDYNLPPPSEIRDVHITSPRRKRRQTEELYIDVLVLIENRLYMKWYNRSNQDNDALRKEDTLMEIRRYYAFVLNGIDVRYKSYSRRMNIRLIGYLIESGGEMAWVRRVRVNESEADQDLYRLNGDSLQDSALQLKQTNTHLPPHDHLMIFTGYDIYYDTGDSRGDLLGIAFFGVVCSHPVLSISVIEDEGSMISLIETGTHELAHGLGVNHDGDNNECRSEDLYIMADGVGYPRNESNMYNSFVFSSCSTKQLTDYITVQLNGRNESRSCMTQMTQAVNVTDLNNTWPGQVFTADDQCKMTYGSNSSLCSGVDGWNLALICHQMLCRTSQDMCIGGYALDGTFCGETKWCFSGKCVNASTVSECDTCSSYPTNPSLTPLSTTSTSQSTPISTTLPPYTSGSQSTSSLSLSLSTILSTFKSSSSSRTSTVSSYQSSSKSSIASLPSTKSTYAYSSSILTSSQTSPSTILTTSTLAPTSFIPSLPHTSSSTSNSSTSTSSTKPPTFTSTKHTVSSSVVPTTSEDVTVSSEISSYYPSTRIRVSTRSMVTKDYIETSQTPSPVRSDDSGLSGSAIGAIVGGTLGGLVLVSGVFWIGYFLYIRQAKTPVPTQQVYSLDEQLTYASIIDNQISGLNSV